MSKIEIEGVDLVLLRGQVAVLCEIAEWLDHSFTDEERKLFGMPHGSRDAVNGVVEMLGERQETE